MAQYFTRKKRTPFSLRFLYLVNRFLMLKNKTKLNLYLDLEWIFFRLAHETAVSYYAENNEAIKTNGKFFLFNKISKQDRVLDLGCNLGEISYSLSEKALNVVGIDYNKKAIEIAKTCLSLPIYPGVTESNIQTVVDAIKDFKI